MTNEHTFQFWLLITLIACYAVRTIARLFAGKRMRDAPPHCIIVMITWSIVLICSSRGLTPYQFHLPIADWIRWSGFLIMITSVIISSVNWADMFAGRMALNAASLADYGSHKLELNSTFVSFAFCCFGAFLLSADLYVMGASIIALFAMGVWVQRDHPRPA